MIFTINQLNLNSLYFSSKGLAHLAILIVRKINSGRDNIKLIQISFTNIFINKIEKASASPNNIEKAKNFTRILDLSLFSRFMDSLLCMNNKIKTIFRFRLEKEISPNLEECYNSNGALEQKSISENSTKTENLGGSII